MNAGNVRGFPSLSAQRRWCSGGRRARPAGIPLKIAAKVDKVDEDYFRAEILPLIDGPGGEFIGEIGLNIQGYGYIRAAGAQSGPPFRSLVASGIPLGAGTDATVVGPMDPWLMMSFMTTGTNNAGQFSGIAGPQISRLQALRMYTSGSAYLSFDDDKMGTHEPGKLADLAVLSDNPLYADEQTFRRMTSSLTLVGGKVVNQGGRFANLRIDQ